MYFINHKNKFMKILTLCVIFEAIVIYFIYKFGKILFEFLFNIKKNRNKRSFFL